MLFLRGDALDLNEDQLIVITGAAGFIGSALVRHLNDQGLSKNLVLVDQLGSCEKWKNLILKNFSEYLPKEELFEWLKGRESEIFAFVHLGACSDTMEKDADFLIQNNYRFTLQLAEYALKNEIRFIYASSAATYGDGSRGFCDDHEMLEELEPLNMYGMSKHLFDLWAKQQGVLHQVTGLKYFNVFGPNETHKQHMASAVIKILRDVQEKKKVSLFKSNDPKFADGMQQRDFIYVKDAVKMTSCFLKNKVCGIFNIGSGKASTWKELATAVINASALDAKIEFIEMPAQLQGKYQNYTCADMRKFETEIGEIACRPLKESVRDYVQEHLLKAMRW